MLERERSLFPRLEKRSICSPFVLPLDRLQYLRIMCSLYITLHDTYFLSLVVIPPLLCSSREKNSKGINRYDPGNRSVESRCALCHRSSCVVILVTKSEIFLL